MKSILWLPIRNGGNPAKLLFYAVLAIAAGVLVQACQRAVDPKQLLGSWQFDAGSQSAKWTYFNDHTWRLSVSGSTNGMLAGDWVLSGNDLTTTTRHSTLAQSPLATGETVTLVRVTSSLMEVKSTKNSRRNIVLKKVSSDDAELALQLSGTWTADVTNELNGMTAHTSSTYGTTGKAIWKGKITAGSEKLNIDKTGEWWVEYGYLCTVVTNPPSGQTSDLNRVCRDEIVEVTPNGLSFRDSEGRLQVTTRGDPR